MTTEQTEHAQRIALEVPSEFALDDPARWRPKHLPGIDGITASDNAPSSLVVPPSPDPVESAVAAFLLALGVDEGDHTADTPARVAKAWRYMLSGYQEDPAVHLSKTFSAPGNPGMVVVSGIRLTSTCAHHLLPITGIATVGYRPRPGQEVVGLSKLSRLVEGYARRLQVQERIGAQVANTIKDVLDPIGGACLITAEHGCMSLRGVQEPCAVTLTTSVIGEWQVNGSQDFSTVLAEHQRSVTAGL